MKNRKKSMAQMIKAGFKKCTGYDMKSYIAGFFDARLHELENAKR